MNRLVSVGLLTSYLRELVESDPLLADLWVEGEVSDLFVARSGHIYFTLRDAESQLKCVLFKPLAQRQRHQPRPGDHLSLHGRISVYERDGAYQLYIDAVQPSGLGLQALQLELLRQQLTLEGLFDPSRKRPIPPSPGAIGVVTSPDGAVWHDIQSVVSRRFPLIHLILSPCLVQGDEAPARIVAALEALQRDGRAEVIIVARGGGSADDLASFNDERVVRAVFACPIPVVSAVGHETDWTLVDEVADLRAPTPSAAAELVTPSLADLTTRIDELRLAAATRISALLRAQRAQTRLATDTIARSDPAAVIASHRADSSRLRRALAEARLSGVIARRTTVQSRSRDLHATMTVARVRRTDQLRLQAALLAALDPARVIERGYAMLTSAESGEPLFSVDQLSSGSALSVRLADGVAAATVGGVARQPWPGGENRDAVA